MKKDPRRITAMISPHDYELLQNMFFSGSDGAMVSRFVEEMTNIIRIELDGLKIFTGEQIEELLRALKDKELSFNTVQPKHSFMYILKDYYKFDAKTRINRRLIEKIDSLSNLQVVILARFLLTFTANPPSGKEFDLDPAHHFFLLEDDEDIRIITKVINLSETKDVDEKLAEVRSLIANLPECSKTEKSKVFVVDKRKKKPEAETHENDSVDE